MNPWVRRKSKFTKRGTLVCENRWKIIRIWSNCLWRLIWNTSDLRVIRNFLHKYFQITRRITSNNVHNVDQEKNSSSILDHWVLRGYYFIQFLQEWVTEVYNQMIKDAETYQERSLLEINIADGCISNLWSSSVMQYPRNSLNSTGNRFCWRNSNCTVATTILIRHRTKTAIWASVKANRYTELTMSRWRWIKNVDK